LKLGYAIVFTSDMSLSVAFYRDVLGLPLKFETPDWTEFATGEATLALHASRGAKSDDGSGRPGSCHPGLQVEDLDAFHTRMLQQGVSCLQEPKDVSGVRIAQYSDPDGLPISVGELRPR